MKKNLISILLIMLCITLIQHSHSFAHAEESISDDSLVINTLYPEGVIDYQNLDGLTCIDINNNYIAYCLNSSNLNIIHNSTRQKLDISTFSCLYDIKFIADNQLLVIDYNKQTNLGSVVIINIDNNSLSTTTINTINVSNLLIADIYHNNNTTLIGFIKTINNSDNKSFELYQLSNVDGNITTQFKDEYLSTTDSHLNTATLLAVSENCHYITFTNSDSPRMLIREYGASTTTTIELLDDFQTIQSLALLQSDTYNYILASSQANLYLLDGNNPNTAITDITCLNVKDIEIFNEKIYISKCSNNTINELTLLQQDTIVLSQNNTIIASSNDAIGRFNNVNNIWTQNDTIYLSDTNNDRIQIINKDMEVSVINNLNVDSMPHSIVLDNSQNIYFNIKTSNTTSAILKYSPSLTLAQQYTTCNTEQLGLIADMTITNNNIIYMLNYSTSNSGQLISLTPSVGLKVAYTQLPFTLTSNSQIDYIRGTDQLVILNNNNIYLFDYHNIDLNQNPIIHTINIPNCTSITTSAYHILAHAGNKIYTLSTTNNQLNRLEQLIESDQLSNISCISYNISSRKIFGFNSNKHSIEYFDCDTINQEFYFSDIHDINLSTQSTQPFAIRVSSNALIYDYPYSTGNFFGNITECIGISTFNEYYRVLFNHNTQLLIGFVRKDQATVIPHNNSSEIRVITTNIQVPLYKYPTILKNNNSAVITDYIPINTYINISTNAFPISIDGKTFYSFAKDGKIGYIFNADVVLDDMSNIIPLNTNNASIQAIGQDFVNIYADDKTTVLYELHNDDRIYVENYDKNSEYTLIIYKDADLNKHVGYVKTEYINMDKLDNSSIALIIIIVISIAILIIIATTYIIIKRKK